MSFLYKELIARKLNIIKMRIAYFIQVHNQPEQLFKLIERLNQTNVDFYVHVDKKSDINSFLKEFVAKKISFIKKRVNVHWGGYSQVQATINGLQEIIESGIEYDYITFLSGQDYPLKSNEKIVNFFSENPKKAFMEFYSIQNSWKEAIPRLNKYHFTDYRFWGSVQIERLLNFVLPLRELPSNLIFVGRSSWFTITNEHVKYILQYLNANKAFVNYLKFTWGCDEFIFQTILYNSPFKDQMVNDNLRYVDWSLGGARPKNLTVADFDKLVSSNKLFARKFSRKIDAEIIDLLDKTN